MGSDSAPATNALSKTLIHQPNELLVWACGLVAHRLAAATQASSKEMVQGCLSALVLISRRVRDTPEAHLVKQILFSEMDVTKALINESIWATRKFLI